MLVLCRNSNESNYKCTSSSSVVHHCYVLVIIRFKSSLVPSAGRQEDTLRKKIIEAFGTVFEESIEYPKS